MLPRNTASPSASSRSVKLCRRSVSSTFALKPAAGRRRIASSTSRDIHAAKPDGWPIARSMSPLKPRSSWSIDTRPLASSVVRPGSVASSLPTCQPAAAGSAESTMLRIVVSPATIAGSLTSIRPGIDGRGTSSSASLNAAKRSSKVRAPLPSSSSASASRTCAPSALMEKRGAAPSSTTACPSAVYGSSASPDSKRNSGTHMR